ncbi:MAG: YlxR family protein [Bacillota bacterium]
MPPKKVPLRMCLGCREMRPKRELIRVVRTPAGTVEIDPTGKRPGRGAYVCGKELCVEQAVGTRRLEKALKTGVPSETIQELRREIERRAGGV